MDKYYTDSMQEAGARLENLLITPPFVDGNLAKLDATMMRWIALEPE